MADSTPSSGGRKHGCECVIIGLLASQPIAVCDLGDTRCRVQVRVQESLCDIVATGEVAKRLAAMRPLEEIKIHGVMEFHGWKVGDNGKRSSVTIHAREVLQ